jgi:hypothetical protein
MPPRSDPFADYQHPPKASRDPFADYQRPPTVEEMTKDTGEGAYRMLPQRQRGYTDTSEEIHVPFSMVESAQTAGWHLHYDEEKRYAHDAKYQGRGPGLPKRIDTGFQGWMTTPEANTGRKPARADIDNTLRAAARVVYALPEYGTQLWQAYKTGDPEFIDMLDWTQIPGNLKKQYDEDRKTDPRLAAQNLAGNVIGLFAPALLSRGLSKFVVDPVKGKVGERVRVGWQTTLGAGRRQVAREVGKAAKEAHAARENVLARNKAADETTLLKRGKVDEANRQAVREREAQRTEIGQQAQAGQAIVDARQGLEEQIERDSAELDRRIQAARNAANAENNAAWADWRRDVAGRETSAEPVTAAIRQVKSVMDPQDVAEFGRILQESKPRISQMPEAEAEREEVSRSLFRKSYNQLAPHELQHTNQVLESMGFDPQTIDESSASIDAGRLHVWKTQLEYAKRSATRGNVRYGIGQVLDAVRKMEDNLTAEAGPDATANLKTARTLHQNYVEAFRNPVKQPRTVAETQLRTRAKAYKTRQAELRRLAQLGRYDPQIPILSEQLREAQERLAAHPTEASARGMIKPAPPPLGPGERKSYEEPEGTKPTEVPEVDTRELRNRLIDEKLQSWTSVSRRQVAKLLFGPLGGVFALLSGHQDPLGFGIGVALGYSAAEHAVLIERLLEQPGVREWLTRPSADELQTLQHVPYADRIRITDTLNRIVAEAERQGKPIKVAKALLPLLAAGSSLKNLRQASDQRKPGQPVTVTAPDGSVHVFQNQAAADEFSRAAGLQ